MHQWIQSFIRDFTETDDISTFLRKMPIVPDSQCFADPFEEDSNDAIIRLFGFQFYF
jgi:hypothetical protein